MNVVPLTKSINALMNKLVIWKMKATTIIFRVWMARKLTVSHSQQSQTVILSYLSFLHDNIKTCFEDLLQLIIPPFVNFLHAMTIEYVMDQAECVQIELCEADDHLIQAYDEIWSKRGYKAQSNIESCLKK